MFLKDWSEKSLNAVAEEVAQAYHAAKRQVNKTRATDNFALEKNQVYQDNLEFLFAVDSAMMTLDSNEQMIIRNSYLRPQEKDWYLKFFARSTFYRLKKKALIKFLKALR